MKKVLLVLVVAAAVAAVAWRCSPRGDGGAPTRGGPTAAGGAPFEGFDPDAENPDRVRYDLGKMPFDPDLVGGVFTRQVLAIPSSLNGVTRTSEDAARYRKYYLGAPLLMEAPDRRDGATLALPWGAVSLPEESEDGTVHVWTLRDDVTWEDGRPVVAEDYVFTLRMMRAEGVKAPQRESFADLVKLEAVDVRRLRATWSRRVQRAVLQLGLDFHVVPAHAVPHDAAGFAAATTHLSCGPYRVAAFGPDGLELVLRDEYRRRPFPPRPHYVERFRFRPLRDPATVYAHLVVGEIDLAQLDWDRFKAAGTDDAFQAAAWRAPVATPSFSLVFWNVTAPGDPNRAPHPLLSDVRVRRALDHLFDRMGVARAYFHGAARPISGPYPPGSPDSDPEILPRSYDPSRAAQLLAEAGFAPGPDGVLVRDGVRCALTLAYPDQPMPPYNASPQAFADAARRIGVAVTLEPLAFDRLTAAASTRARDAVMILWQVDFIEPDVADVWRSRGAFTDAPNWSAYVDDALDRLFDALDAENDPARRSAIRRKIHRRLHEEAPCSFLFSAAAPVGFSRRFANLEVHDLGVRLWDAVERSRFARLK
ncbi:MAG TPA: ABC transporter substrate-binding protein [Planctomycetota bacterium]|nr:ABC transporter substrate-binding protein [Planctomycetota bacterium]